MVVLPTAGKRDFKNRKAPDMGEYRMISSDSHVCEPPDLWTSRIEPELRDRAPRLVREDNGSDWWYCEGQRIMSTAGAGAQPGGRFEDPENLIAVDSPQDIFENVWPGAYIPDERLKDMERDGCYADVIYPTLPLNIFTVQNSLLLDAICRAYNDWIADFCGAFPTRLKGIAMINVDDVGVAVKELERCANKGLAGALVPNYLPWGESYSLPKYDPFWAAAQDLAVPISLHEGTMRPGEGQPLKFGHPKDPRPTMRVNRDHWMREVISELILDGVFERYPKLRVGAVEYELAWAPHFLDRLNYVYAQRSLKPAWHKFNEDMLPSDYFHRNVFVSFQEDALGIKERHIIGVDNIMWGSDYPHLATTFPRSREILAEILADCTEEEKAKIVEGNAAKLYHFD